MKVVYSRFILWMILAILPAFAFAQPMANQLPKGGLREIIIQSKSLNCGDIVFSMQVINNGSACCYRLIANNSNPDNCFMNIGLTLNAGEFTNFTPLPGWQYNTGGPADYTVRPAMGFILQGTSMIAEFCIEGASSATLTLLWEDGCILESCAAEFDVNGCLDPGDANISGVAYLECGTLLYSNQVTLPDWPVQLLDTMGNVIAEQVTDLNGAYAFYDLMAGQYVVKAKQRPEWTFREPANGLATVELGPSGHAERNFGNCPGCSCDSIYLEITQLPGASDSCTYKIHVDNNNDACYRNLHISLASGSLSSVMPSTGWTSLQMDSQHVKLNYTNGYVPEGFHEPCTFRVSGASTQELTVSTIYNIGAGDVTCTRAFLYLCPAPENECVCPNSGSPGNNLVVNGNFTDLGGFTSNYVLNNIGPLLEGQYWVGTNPSLINAGFQACGDHTTGTGNMMVVNGATNSSTKIWCETITVTANTHYRFSAWIASVVTASSAQLQLFVNNVSMGAGFLASAPTCDWQKYCQSWFSGTNTTATICLVNLNAAAQGNDFALDGISFRECLACNPNNPEICNGLDDNCDGLIDNDLAVCPPPTNLMVTNIGTTSATLSWTPSLCSDSQWIILDTDLAKHTYDNVSTIVLENLTPGVTHYVYMMSGCDSLMSEHSDTIIFTTASLCQTTVNVQQLNNCGLVQVNTVTSGPIPATYQWCDGRTEGSFITSQLPCVPVTYCVTTTCADGSTSTASVIFTAFDLISPTAVCNLGIGVDLGTSCTFQVTPAFVDGGSTDDCGIQSMSVSPNVLTSCTMTTVTLTVTDWCNNTSTCTMGIQTAEAVPPVMTCPPNTTVNGVFGPTGCTAVYQPVQPVAFDNCAPSVSLSNDAPPVLIAGQNTITWTATDNCNNVSTCTVDITVSCDNCACGSFSNTCLRSGTSIACTPVLCGAAAINLECPAPGFGYDFTGQFDCQGLCTTPLISWQFSGPSGTFTGTTIPWPFFCIDLLPTYFGTAGQYTLTLQGHCDGLDCTPCVYQFNIDCGNVCSCDLTALQSNVEAGFASILSNNSCKGCFSATALTDCDAVEWFINGLSKGSSIGWEKFCYMFPSAGTYAVKMLVTRRNSDGSVCGVLSYTRNVAVTCLNSADCNNSVLSNPRFSEGSPIAGNLNAEGFCAGWKAISGEPYVLEEEPAETLDAWALYITGNLDSSDVVSSAMPICVEDSGIVSLRVAGEPIPGRDIKLGRTPPGSTMFVVLYQGNNLDIHNCDNCYKLVSVDGLLPLDSGEWVQIEAPFNLNNWATVDHCGDGDAGIPVRIAVYITSPFGTNQGGLENGYRAELDNLCLDGTLVSVKNPTERLYLRILPNPNAGTFNVELPQPATPGMFFRIIGLTGQMLREQLLQNGDTIQTVSAGDLAPGLYFLQVVSEGKVLAVEKFVKQ